MRILDEQGQEITPEEADATLGYLREERILVKEIQEQHHYTVGCFYFENGSYRPIGENDPHIKIIDAKMGKFEYVPQEGEPKRTIRGMDINLVIDQPYKKEYENILRYIKYTEEELVQRTLPDRMTSAEATLEETGLTVEDLILLMAEVLGGDGEEIPQEEETPQEETPSNEAPQENIEEMGE